MSCCEQIVFLLPCVSRKLTSRAAACDLYQSALFLKMRAVVDRIGAPWSILSAKYGLLDPHQTIEPYDLTLKDMRAAERRAWAKRVITQMEKRLPPADCIIVLAGRNYREFLMGWLRGRARCVETPLARFGIGEQLQHLDEWKNRLEWRSKSKD